MDGAFLNLIMSGFKASTELNKGTLEKAEAEYNARLYDIKAENIEVQKGIEFKQYEGLKRRYAGEITAGAAKSGLAFTGSPVAMLSSTLANIEMDKQIGQYNLEVEKRYTQSEAENLRMSGRLAEQRSRVNAFSTMLSGGFDYGMKKGWISVK